MRITSAFQITINDSGHVVFEHPINNQEANKYLEDALNKDYIVRTNVLYSGLRPNSATEESKRWEVKTYDGLKKVVLDYSSKFSIYVTNSDLNTLN